jgi:O-antigen/teichoic acid export membrane protein
MFDKFKHFLKHSIVYSVSNVASKASGIILLPIYTKYFSVEDFGRLGLIIAIITIMVQIVILGQGQSVIRFLNQKEFENNKKSVFFSISSFVFVVIVVFILLCQSSTQYFSNLLDESGLYYNSLKISIYIIAVTVLNNVFQNKLRTDEKSIFYTILNLIKLIVMMVLTIYFIVQLKFGIDGVLYGQLISEAVALIIILPFMIKDMEAKIDFEVLKTSLVFGIPLIFSALSMTLLNISDRFLIKFLADENALGLYELGYRVAGILNMFLIVPLSLTLLPVAYKIFEQPGDKEYYIKIMTYVTYILVWGALFLSVFSKEIISLFSSSTSFIPSYEVVPIILFSYVFFGMSMISSLGFYLVGKTGYVAVITILSAAINIALNLLLIPKYGIMGAAINTLIAFIFLYFISLIMSNRFYKINFEHKKLFSLIFLGLFLFIVSKLTDSFVVYLTILSKLILVSLYPFILFWTSFYEPKEIKLVRGFVKKWKNPSDWIENIKKESFDLLNRN